MTDSGVTITEICDGVLDLRFKMPFGVQAINVFVLTGDRVTLVDTGPILADIPDRLYAALDEVGHPAASIDQIVLTHHHADHMGLASRLRSASGAVVVCHELGAGMIGDYDSERIRQRDYMIGLATFMGLDPERARESFLKPSAWDTAAESVTVDRAVADGDVVRAGSRDLRVIHTPGHTIDHICLYDPEDRLMLTGDMLLKSITPNPDVYTPWLSDKQSGLPDYIDSLHKIRGAATSLALPGHGDIITDFDRRIDEVLMHHDERLEFLRLEVSGEEKTVLQLAIVLLASISSEMTGVDVFLAMREVFGHLVILEQSDKVRMELREGTAWYMAT